MNYRLACDDDMDRIIDFINMVFSMVRVPHDFEALLPKVYGAGRRLADIHILAEDETGRICGCFGMYVFPLRVAGKTLRIGYLGSMSVHPRVRGQGTMGELVRRQVIRANELGLDMLALGGQRQRYQYGGFETGGASYTYSISRANVRHALAQTDDGGLTFRAMREADVPFLFALYDGQAVSGARSQEGFVETLKSFHHDAWTVERKGEPVGYLCASADRQTVSELVLSDAGLILPSIKAWMGHTDVRMLHVCAAPYDVTLNSLLAPICESDSLAPGCMLRVLRPENVLAAYMQLKHTVKPLEYGRLVLGWEGLGSFCLSVSERGIGVEATREEPEIALCGLDMHRLLFSCNRFAAPSVKNRLADNWFPLPVYIPEADSF